MDPVVDFYRLTSEKSWLAQMQHYRHRQLRTCLTLVNMPCPISIPAVVTMTDPSAIMLTTAGRGCTMLRNLQP